MASVVVERASKTFQRGKQDRFNALVDVSLTINDREFMVLVGPSGCGKSTLLRLIAGLESPSSGSILIDDRPMNGVEPKDRDIAMVFQNYALYPHMSVFDNMAFGLQLRKLPKTEIHERIRNAAQILGLDQLLDRLPRELSGGQRQRVAVGRAIVRQPKAFLFDEPLSNLDAQMRTVMRQELIRLHRRLAATMIYVTHDQSEAMTMGDRIAVLNQGRLQQVDPPVKLYSQPANLFVAGFIGSPPMNLIAGKIHPPKTSDTPTFQSHTTAPQPPISVPLPRDSHPHTTDITIGIRPEHLQIGTPPASEVLAVQSSGQIDLIEPMGSETFVHLATPSGRLIARCSPETPVHTDQTTPFYFDASRVHWFDSNSGHRL